MNTETKQPAEQHAPDSQGGPVRVTLNLPAEVVRLLKELAEKEGRTMTEIIRRGIETEDFIHQLRMKDAKIIVKEDWEESILVFK